MDRRILILSLSLVASDCCGQDAKYDIGEIIEGIVEDKTLAPLLFSYDYHGDRPLFIAYNDVLKDLLSGSKYQIISDWEHGLDFTFDSKRVFLREHGFLFSERVGYYLQIDSISLNKDMAFLLIRTNTMSGKLMEVKYFVGEVRLARTNGVWLVEEKKLVEKNPDDKW